MPKVLIKPLSVNDAWRGRRFKTPEYQAYELELIYKLPSQRIPEGKLRLKIEFGVSNMTSDVDNLLKPTIDCLQKKYGFNDRLIHEIHARKIKTKKREEYIHYELTKIV